MTNEEIVETVHKEIMTYFVEPLSGHRGLASAVVALVLEEARREINVLIVGESHEYARAIQEAEYAIRALMPEERK